MKPDSKAYKYFQDRLCQGGDCTAKTEYFLVEGAVERTVDLYHEEQIEVIKKRLLKYLNPKLVKEILELNQSPADTNATKDITS